MERIGKIRKYVDEIYLRAETDDNRRSVYLHLYGVSQFCALIALRRGEDSELAAAAGMLHDIYTLATLETKEHARKGAEMAEEILTSLCVYSPREIALICGAIGCHSKKAGKFSSFDEVLIDADVLQHCLYNPLSEPLEKDKPRYESLRSEFAFLPPTKAK